MKMEMERVPGCVATVHLQVTLLPPPSGDTNSNPQFHRVRIDGASDALLSRGLLALVSDAFRDDAVTAEDVLRLDPDRLASAMGLRSVLSRGRNDGVASMVRVAQGQIRRWIERYEKNDGGDDIDGANQRPAIHDHDHDDEEFVAATAVPRRPTVAVLLSGGVDSSVALHLLLRRNYDVTAFYLRIWLEDELSHLGTCPWEDDLEACRAVCDHANAMYVRDGDGDGHGTPVRLETVSLGKEYRERVVQYTIEEARKGRTPNPDIMCNARIKFGCFLDWIEHERGMDFDYVASGHYARLEHDDDDEVKENETLEVTETDTDTDTDTETLEVDKILVPRKKRLYRAPDPVKDQSYFLCALTQKQLSKVLFPLGRYRKSEVRDLALTFGLPNRHRPDSQGLCFLGKVKFDDFLSSYLGDRPGDVVDASTGDVVGRHRGLWYHTVGQRKGIGKVMTPLATARGPWYVVAKDPSEDVVYVSNRYDERDFVRARSEFEVEDVRWIGGEAPVDATNPDGGEEDDDIWREMRLEMKIRHGPKIVEGTLTLKGDGSSGNVRLDEKDGGVSAISRDCDDDHDLIMEFSFRYLAMLLLLTRRFLHASWQLAPGQYVVFYQPGTEECLGAGVISERHWANFLRNYNQLIGSSS
ncbi:hypothetical protein ACHAXS_003576 [Conticribra weissflogii]